MAGLFVQQRQGSNVASSTTLVSGSTTITAGNALALIVCYTGATTTVTPGTTYGTFVEDVSLQHAAAGGVGMHVFTCDSAIGITGQLTITWGAAVTRRGLYIVEMSGIDHYLGGVFPAYQASPGTGADAVTSGNYNVISPPVYLLGLGWDSTGGGAGINVGAAAAANYTSQGTGWLMGDATFNARLMDARAIASGNIAASFTAVTGTDTFAALELAFAESIASSVLMSQCMY